MPECRRHPPLISQHPNTVAERMVNIKQLLPKADVPQLVSKRPSILCMEVRGLAWPAFWCVIQGKFRGSLATTLQQICFVTP